MNVKRSFISISTITAMLLLTACSSGGSGGSSSAVTEEPVTETTTIDLSGSVIDGYVAGADVVVNGYSTVSNATGFWSIPDVTEKDGIIIEASGGTDTSTGEPFEGKLKASVAKGQTTAHVTPLSTIVTSVVESGKSVEEANTVVSTQLGISEEALTADPIETLKSGTPAQKTEAAKVVKTALVVQKMAETISKSAGANTADQNTIFDAVMDSVATQLQSNLSFDEVMADTTTIITNAAAQVAEEGTSTVENLSKKMAASADSASEVVKMVQAIDEKSLAESTDVTASMLATGKALEIVTAAVEKAMVKVAEAQNTESITEAQTQATKTTQTITMLGGVTGVAVAIEKQTTQAEAGTITDASIYSESMFSPENIEAQSTIYDTLKDSGMTADMITNVGTKLSAKTEGETPLDFAQIVADVIETAPAELEISSDALETITAAVEESSVAAVAAVEVAAEAAEVVVETPTEPEDETPTETEDETSTEPEDETPTETEDETSTETEDETSTETEDETSTETEDETSSSSSSSSSSTTDDGARTISTTDSITANSVAETFTITSDTNSTYTYTITSFDTTTDKLYFGTGIDSSYINIINTADDNEATLHYTPDAGLTNVNIILDGLTQAQDMALTTSTGVDAILKID